MGPLIAIIGRPNVGKSTLFNSLVGQNLSLVADFPGLTRDRKYGSAYINNFSYIFIDTAGITDSDDEFEKQVLNETQKALKEADGFIFLVDATTPLNSLDLEINDMLRKSGKDYLLCVNKSDQKSSEKNLQDFFELGVKITLKISAKNKNGLMDLRNKISEQFISNVSDNKDFKEENLKKIGILGKPNAGKSTFFNKILKDNRSIVSKVPGTTVDSITEEIKFKNQLISITDTAGLRKKGKIKKENEIFSSKKSINIIRNSEGIIYLIDGKETVTDQDLHLLSLIISSGKSLIIGINKSESLSAYEKTLLKKSISKKLSFVSHIEVSYISALKGIGTSILLNKLLKLVDRSKVEFKSQDLNKFIKEAQDINPPSMQGRFRPKIKFVNIGSTSPPTFIFHGNQLEKLNKSYKKYMENFLRKKFKLQGIPIQLIFKANENPFKDKKNKLTKRQYAKRKRVRSH
ncbi:MAG: ribosome biogenesis GTPase Der [Gammaproteobacteria bacterium]|nr:MAG: ribosome biogenesis GTPase Der [Gammaproteobacteria bacterium]|tara:strand:- start:9673 stop:11055 length:1383 start_codon:yes stop_codon:yes gene_type:complete